MIDAVDAKKMAALFAAVAEPTRVLVLHHLTGGPLHVGRLADLVGIPIVNMSHHLGVMRQAGILDDDKKGRRVVYSLRKDIFDPGDDDHYCILTFGKYRIGLRRNPTPIPVPTSTVPKRNKKAGT
ncbi:MAG TPA: metalloregulator ArsR/SmtB family transcription factor [Fimbriiglobus sp.]|jgi:DNA-binding transcriptional ArsR family regulator